MAPERIAALEAGGVGGTLCDVGDPDQVDHLFDRAKAALGGLDILVNNAGIAGPTAAVEDIAVADWERTITVDLNGQFYCARRAVPLIKAAGGGSIVNLSSSAGIMGYPNRTPYAAAKWAVVGLTKSLAMELGGANIRVNAICPGPVSGARMDRVLAAEAALRGESVETALERELNKISMHTFVEAGDIAAHDPVHLLRRRRQNLGPGPGRRRPYGDPGLGRRFRFVDRRPIPCETTGRNDRRLPNQTNPIGLLWFWPTPSMGGNPKAGIRVPLAYKAPLRRQNETCRSSCSRH